MDFEPYSQETHWEGVTSPISSNLKLCTIRPHLSRARCSGLTSAGRPVGLSHWGSPPSLGASAVSRVCDGKSCSDSKRNPPSLAFLTHFLILPTVLRPGAGPGADRPELAAVSVLQ